MRSRKFPILLVSLSIMLSGVSPLFAGSSRHRAVAHLDTVEGITTGVTASSLTVRTGHQGDLSLHVVAATEVIVDGRPASIAAIAAGDAVEVSVRKEADDSSTALQVKAEKSESHVEIEGTVKSLTATLLTVTTPKRDVSLKVTAQTLAVVNGQPAALSAITAGMRVVVDAVRHADDTYDALLIKANSQIVETAGVISAVSASSVTLTTADGRTVTIQLTSATVVQLGKETVPASALKSGMHANVEAIRNAEGTLTALRVHAEAEHHLGEVHGTLTAVGSASITVHTRSGEDVTIAVPADAIIRKGDQTVALSALKVGDHVEVTTRLDGTTLTAVRIQIENEKEGELAHVSGTISAISGSMITLATRKDPIKVFITSTTVIRREGQTVPVSSLQTGQAVSVKGHPNSDGSIEAVEVEIGQSGGEGKRPEATEFDGVVTTASATSVTIATGKGNLTAAITAATVIRKGDHAATAADLKAGVRVHIKTARASDGTYTALSITIQDEGHHKSDD